MSEEKKKRVYRKRNTKRDELIRSFCAASEAGKQLAESVDKMATKYNLTADAIYKILRNK